jgi:hypothetical protein
MRDQRQPNTKTRHLEGGSPPLMPELAAVMPAGTALMDQLVTQFAPIAAALSTQQAYWIAFNGWLTGTGFGWMLGFLDVNAKLPQI